MIRLQILRYTLKFLEIIHVYKLRIYLTEDGHLSWPRILENALNVYYRRFEQKRKIITRRLGTVNLAYRDAAKRI